MLLVTQLDLPCLRNVVRLMMSFDEVDGLKDKTKIVVNRVGLDAGQIGLKKAQETIGREIFWQIPNDYRTMVEVRNNGVPLMEQFPKASITQAVVALAATLTGENAGCASAEKAAGAGWLSFWSSRRQLCEKRRLRMPRQRRRVPGSRIPHDRSDSRSPSRLRDACFPLRRAGLPPRTPPPAISPGFDPPGALHFQTT